MVSIEELSGDEPRGRLNLLSNAAGPRDLRRAAQDRVAVAGNTVRIRECMDAGVGERFLKLWFHGIELELLGKPPRVILEDYPSVRDQPEVAATEFDCPSSIGKIH